MNTAIISPDTMPEKFTSRGGRRRLPKSQRDKIKAKMPPLKAALWIGKVPFLKATTVSSFMRDSLKIQNDHVHNELLNDQKRAHRLFMFFMCLIIPPICYLLVVTPHLFYEGKNADSILCVSAAVILLGIYISVIRKKVAQEDDMHNRIFQNHMTRIRDSHSPSNHEDCLWKLHAVNDPDDVEHISAGIPNAVRAIIFRVRQLKLPHGYKLSISSYGICGMLVIHTPAMTYHLAAWHLRN